MTKRNAYTYVHTCNIGHYFCLRKYLPTVSSISITYSSKHRSILQYSISKVVTKKIQRNIWSQRPGLLPLLEMIYLAKGKHTANLIGNMTESTNVAIPM